VEQLEQPEQSFLHVYTRFTGMGRYWIVGLRTKPQGSGGAFGGAL